MLIPAIVAGKLTLGVMNQVLNVFGQVRESFQYLVGSWTTIVELLSIYKRLKAFESVLVDEPLPKSTGSSSTLAVRKSSLCSGGHQKAERSAFLLAASIIGNASA